MKFILFHGSFGHPQENWFPRLREQLEILGQDVLVPEFPSEDFEEITKLGKNIVPSRQSLENWFKVFEKEVLPALKKGEKLCFIGHSLGPLFILHVVSKYNIRLDCAIFVSPFMEKLNNLWQFDLVNKTFYKTDFDFDQLKKLIPVSYVLYSENDPYVSKSHPILFAKMLDSSLIFVKKAGHMNSAVNLNEFPLVLDLCLTRLDLSMYQRYIKHRSERYASDYLKKNNEKIIHLKPEEIFDEGRFHFSNLTYSGFGTFPTWVDDWNPRGQYYQDCREAAKRLKNMTFVFLIKNLSELNRKILREHIKLHLQASIRVRLCLLKDVKSKIKEVDFGNWDQDYICTIKWDKNKKMKEIVLSSRSEDLERARQDEKLILGKSTRIYNSTRDIDNFSKSHSKN
ncbi:alpha/beta hydrolase [Candidatus Microgenomates bacterium]|nr:alpha/beta hydrolase [Candidatus Microgenomates bacterium]